MANAAYLFFSHACTLGFVSDIDAKRMEKLVSVTYCDIVSCNGRPAWNWENAGSTCVGVNLLENWQEGVYKKPGFVVHIHADYSGNCSIW